MVYCCLRFVNPTNGCDPIVRLSIQHFNTTFNLQPLVYSSMLMGFTFIELASIKLNIETFVVGFVKFMSHEKF